MNETQQYDVTIIGGGLAGLGVAIQLGRQGYRVALLEKEQYPFHKVCGEYISMESWNFIESLGLPLSKMDLPRIKKLIVSSPNGTMLTASLPLGGFGISRFTLDEALKQIAVNSNVSVFEKCKVEEVVFINETFRLQSTRGNFTSSVCCGSFGKRSNLDIKWKRDFIFHKNNKLSNYVGVKYHIKTNFAADTIALHNFKNGYCGRAKIDKDEYCLCYLSSAANLANNNNSIQQMEQNVLYKNRHLKNIFENSELIFNSPITISQISFSKKTQVHDHLLLLGDAAGMITPLCGNGMSMALHGSKIAASVINDFLQHTITRPQLEKKYTAAWKKAFAARLRTGRILQSFFGGQWRTNFLVRSMKLMPGITRWVISQTHGKPF